MCKTTNLIHSKKSIKDLSHKDIAEHMSEYLTRRVGSDSVQKYFAGNSGIPMEHIGALLSALDLKLVDSNEVSVPDDEYAALKLFAKKALK